MTSTQLDLLTEGRQQRDAALANTRVIPGYHRELAGEDGHIYLAHNGRRLAEFPSRDGYLRVVLVDESAPGRRKDQAVAKLIACAFHGPRPEGLQIRHLDGDKTNNLPENLAYGTALENARDRDRHGTTARGLRIKNARHTQEQVAEAKALVAAGMCQRDVAARFGCTQSTVWRWVHGVQRDVA